MKKSNPCVSIIIPVYNVEKYIERCLESVVNQTYKNLEIIVVDDGSLDNSYNVIKNYINDKRIKYYHKENGGLGSARNYGFSKSTSDYIIFLDSDDYIELNAVESMVKYADYDIVCVGFDRVDEITKKVYSREMINMPFDELIIDKNNLCETAFLSPAAWGKMFKREVIKNINFSNDKKAIEDILFYLEYIPKVKKIKYIKKVIWHYMVRSNSLITSISLDKCELFDYDLLSIKDKYVNNKYTKEYFNYLTLQVIIHNCISLPSRLYNNKDVNINKRLKYIKKYMNNNFENWKHIKINIKGRFVKKLAIHIIILMYRMNIFKLFLFMYNFMINKLKIDVKW